MVNERLTHPHTGSGRVSLRQKYGYQRKIYGLTKEDQRLKKRFLRVDIAFKSEFNSMSQASLWVILEAYNISDIDLLKSLYEYITVRLPHSDVGRDKVTFNTGVSQALKGVSSPPPTSPSS